MVERLKNMKTSLIPFLVLFSLATYAQTDSIFLQKEVLVGEIKSIEPVFVTLVKTGDSFLTTLSKLEIKSIKPKNGAMIEIQSFDDTLNLNGKTKLKPRFSFEKQLFSGLQGSQIESVSTMSCFRFRKEYKIRKAYAKLEKRALIMNCNHILIHHASATTLTAELFSTTHPKPKDFDSISDIDLTIQTNFEVIYTKRTKNKLETTYAYRKEITITIHRVFEKENQMYAQCTILNQRDSTTELINLLIIDLDAAHVTLFHDEGKFISQYRIERPNINTQL